MLKMYGDACATSTTIHCGYYVFNYGRDRWEYSLGRNKPS